MTATIVMEGLVKQYPNGVRGVDGVDLSIADGEFFALLGPSGCGKTTLLRSIAGLEAITGGTLRIGGADMTDVEPGRRGVAMVFQDYALFPHMDVSDNIAYPLRIRRVAKAQRRRAAADTAKRLSLTGLLERRPAQLSGGQQQRVALARAMRREPAEGTRVRWGVRPEYVRWSDDGADDGPGAVSGRVHAVENLGAQNLLTMRCGDGRR